MGDAWPQPMVYTVKITFRFCSSEHVGLEKRRGRQDTPLYHNTFGNKEGLPPPDFATPTELDNDVSEQFELQLKRCSSR
jgi:hypothetical protein